MTNTYLHSLENKGTFYCSLSKTLSMINLLCISLLVCKLSSSQAAWSRSVLWTAWIYHCQVCSMVNQLNERKPSLRLAQALRFAGLCLYCIKMSSVFLYKLQNEMYFVIWGICCHNRSLHWCDVFLCGCMITFLNVPKDNADIALLVRLLYVIRWLCW
jgi:hypothetical protein